MICSNVNLRFAGKVVSFPARPLVRWLARDSKCVVCFVIGILVRPPNLAPPIRISVICLVLFFCFLLNIFRCRSVCHHIATILFYLLGGHVNFVTSQRNHFEQNENNINFVLIASAFDRPASSSSSSSSGRTDETAISKERRLTRGD